ncbi:ATP synthase subunit I [Palleronia sp.]|uniref:N-ATPase subunit AtpR n=1 Tax=Palleronia sp. TaxID=1940284 RepID=UPI0035C859EB
MTPDLIMLGAGLAAGALAAALYLAGLAIGMRMAWRRARPLPILLASAALRIGALLAAGYGAALVGTQAVLSFAVGFLVVRMLIVQWVRAAPSREATSWN